MGKNRRLAIIAFSTVQQKGVVSGAELGGSGGALTDGHVIVCPVVTDDWELDHLASRIHCEGNAKATRQQCKARLAFKK